MRCTTGVSVLATFVAVTLLPAQDSQSYAPFKGAYSYVEEGINPAGQAYYRAGILELDGTGGAIARDITRGPAGTTSQQLSGSYRPMDDGTVEVKLLSTASPSEEDEPAVTTLHSTMRLMGAGEGAYEGLRTDSGYHSVLRAESYGKGGFAANSRYTLVESGASVPAYSALGSIEFRSSEGGSGALLVKQTAVESISAAVIAQVDSSGIATVVLLTDNDTEPGYRATYRGVPFAGGRNWALIRTDSGKLGMAWLYSR